MQHPDREPAAVWGYLPGIPTLDHHSWSRTINTTPCADYRARVRSAEDALPANAECNQRGGPRVLLSPRGCSVQAHRHQQYPPLHNIIPVILADVPLHNYAHQCSTGRLMLPKAGGHGDHALQSIYSIACSTCAGRALAPRGVRLGEHVLQRYMPKKCCQLSHHTVRAAVPETCQFPGGLSYM